MLEPSPTPSLPTPCSDSESTNSVHVLLNNRIVHDSVDFLASEQEVETVGKTLREVIKKVDFGRDLEQQLKILIQARGIFINFDHVTDLLVLIFANEELCIDKKGIIVLRTMSSHDEV